MDITEILKQPFHLMTQKDNLKVLVKDYEENFNRNVCVSCPSSLNEMILTLKKYYKMSDFRIKNNGYYRLSRESSKTINNNIITDELAIEFLQLDPERIKLFESYPDNWEELINSQESEDTEEVSQESEEIDESMEQGVEREILMEMKMYELREKYPDIKATSKEEFITELFKTQA